jgi:hypothetical protein
MLEIQVKPPDADVVDTKDSDPKPGKAEAVDQLKFNFFIT